MSFEPDSNQQSAPAGAHGLTAENASQAETRAREMLREVPGDPHALLMLGAALRRQGRVSAARQILESLAAGQSPMPSALFELSLTLITLREIRAAVAALKRTVAIDPGHADAWRTLGDLLVRHSDGKDADAAYARYFELSIADPQLREAAAALRDERPEIADRLLGEYLELHPTDVNALKLSAECAFLRHRFAESEALLARCLELAPEFTEARYRYATALLEQGKASQGLAELNALLERDPHNFLYRQTRAITLVRTGAFAEAAIEHEILLKDSPNQPRAWITYGHTLKTLGRGEECIVAYKRAIALNGGLGNAWWGLANLGTYRFEFQDIDVLRTQLARTDVERRNRGLLTLTLARALEDVSRYAESFAYYDAANALLRTDMRYSADETTDFVQRSKSLFTPAFFRDRAGSGCRARDPIFIVGLPRSGSTLVEQILASHSAIEGTNGRQAIVDIVGLNDGSEAGDDVSFRYPESLAGFNAQHLTSLGEKFLERTRWRRTPGRPHFTDRMPENFRHVGLVHLILPNAHIVDVRRHPMECCFSNFRQHFGGGRAFAYSLGDLGRYYRDYVELMAHFDEVLPDRIHRVIYEQLVADPEKEVRRLLGALNLPFEEGCLRFYENDRLVRAASSEQVRMPIFKDRIDQWRRFERWLEPLKTGLGYVLDTYPEAPGFYTRLHTRIEPSNVSWATEQVWTVGSNSQKSFGPPLPVLSGSTPPSEMES